MLVSIVIVTTGRRSKFLRRILDFIHGHNFSFNLEVVIISCGERFVYSDKELRYPTMIVYVPYDKGLGWARNIGVKLSKGDYVLFLDDDIIIPNKSSIEKLVEYAKKYPIVGGNLKPLYETNSPVWFSELSMGHLIGVGNIYHEAVYGASMLIRRELFQTLGLFRPELGRMRDSLVGCEDYEFVTRAKLAGYKFKTVKEAVFLHYVPQRRLLPSYIIKRALADGVNWALLDLVLRYRHERFKILFRVLRFTMSLPTDVMKFFLSKNKIYQLLPVLYKLGYILAILVNEYAKREYRLRYPA